MLVSTGVLSGHFNTSLWHTHNLHMMPNGFVCTCMLLEIPIGDWSSACSTIFVNQQLTVIRSLVAPLPPLRPTMMLTGRDAQTLVAPPPVFVSTLVTLWYASPPNVNPLFLIQVSKQNIKRAHTKWQSAAADNYSASSIAPSKRTFVVFCDNVSADYLSANPIHHHRTKLIEMRIHFFHEKVALGNFRVVHFPITLAYITNEGRVVANEGLIWEWVVKYRRGQYSCISETIIWCKSLVVLQFTRSPFYINGLRCSLA